MPRSNSLFYMLTFWIIAPATAVAYPISPEPLWQLTGKATLIVVAEVTAVEPLISKEEDQWASAVAYLRVLETLKGPRRTTVEVPYAANLLCPAPARYATGETVVAFLVRNRRQWRTVALSYGTLYPRGDDLEDMKTIVRAALMIQKNSVLESKTLKLRKRKWLVQAAALPGTRWHGLYELDPGGDGIRSYFDQQQRTTGPPIAQQHLALLADAFVEAPRVDHTLAMMLRVLHGHADPRVDQVALSALESLLALDQPPWWTWDLLRTFLARSGDSDPEERLEELGAEPWQVTPGQLRRIWSGAKGQLGIPEMAPEEIELEEYVPVGGRTPS